MIAEKNKAPGHCMLCHEVFNKAQMTSHLKKCISGHDAKAGKPEMFFHLVIEGRHMPMYWMHVEMPGRMTLKQLDAFLREIWLECCGHLSCFTINGQRHSSYTGGADFFGMEEKEKSMTSKIGNILGEGTRFTYEYDFGSTTDLTLRVIGIREGLATKASVTLLARNVPPVWKCVECGKPATLVIPKGWGAEEDAVFCENCADEDNEYGGLLPLVNSPRTGVCGYIG